MTISALSRLSTFVSLFLRSVAVLVFCFPGSILKCQQQPLAPAADAPAAQPGAVEWSSANAQHAFGFPEVKPKTAGSLTLTATSLEFSGKHAQTSIPRSSITSVSSGHDRVELWGTGGQLMRMAMPQGSGLAAGALMHHRVDMLTVQFQDVHGGGHSAVFYLPANEADRAVTLFGRMTGVPAPAPAPAGACATGPYAAQSVLVEQPDWGSVEAPAAYKAMVYERIVDRLQHTKGVERVERAGESSASATCPGHTVHIALEGFKQGSQVVRAATGPIGMFTSATSMIFNVTYTDRQNSFQKKERVKASVRSQSENISVADSVAKKVAKQYASLLKHAPTAGATESGS